METPAFARVQERKEVVAVPLRDLLAAQPKRLLLGMGTRYVEGFTFNLYSVYLLAYVVTNLELPKQWALNGILVGSFLGVLLVPLAGALSDRHGRKPVFRVGAWAALLFAFPMAALVQSETRLGIFVALVGGLGVLYGVVYGPLAAFWSELFDTRYRYTALSSLYQISGIVASGLTPLIAAWLVSRAAARCGWSRRTPSSWRRSAWSPRGSSPRPRGRDLDEAWKAAPGRPVLRIGRVHPTAKHARCAG